MPLPEFCLSNGDWQANGNDLICDILLDDLMFNDFVTILGFYLTSRLAKIYAFKRFGCYSYISITDSLSYLLFCIINEVALI